MADFTATFDELRSAAVQSNPRCVGKMLENQEIAYIVPTRSWPRQRATESALEVIGAIAVFWQELSRALSRYRPLGGRR